MLSLRRFVPAVAALVLAAPLLAAESTPTPPTPATTTEIAPADPSLFAYDRAAPLEVKDVGAETRNGVLVRDITFVGVKDPIKAFIVSPASASAPAAESLAGILYVHWLGEPSTTNRTEFLAEATALASRGIVSLLVDTMWAQPKWYPNRIPENDYAEAVRQVIELRRAMDLLLAQPGIDPKRVAFVGHDFGAMYGLVAEALDRRACTSVLLTPVPRFIDWFLFARQPKDLEAYRRQLAPLDPMRFAARVAPAPVFFQFASHDQYVTAAAAAEFYAAAGVRKQCATYDAGHDLHNADASADRVAWLIRELSPAR